MNNNIKINIVYKTFKKVLIVCLTMLLFILFSCKVIFNEKDLDNVFIICTGDIHSNYKHDENEKIIGLEYISGIKEKFVNEGKKVFLVDAGDATNYGVGNVVGDYIYMLMDEAKYDVLIPGNNDFRMGIKSFLEFNKNRPFISSNITKNGDYVLPKYNIFDVGNKKIGFIGVTTPLTIQEHTFVCFQNDSNIVEYDFGISNFYSAIQKIVNEVKQNGADIVVAITHLGKDGNYSATKLINNIIGVDAIIDGHSHIPVEKSFIYDKNGEKINYINVGNGCTNIGLVEIKSNNDIDTCFIDTKNFDLSLKFVENMERLENEYQETIGKVVGINNYALVNSDFMNNETYNIGNPETNLGDLIADSYRNINSSDCAIVNNIMIRNDIISEDITYEKVFRMFPFNYYISTVKVKGSVIRDLLEMGAAKYPVPSSNFIQVSGIKYDIDSNIETSVEFDDNLNFVKVNGDYRVKNIFVNNMPLELDKEYTLNGISHIVKDCWYGMSMFKDANIINENIIIDKEAFIRYIKEELNGVIPEKYKNTNGNNRINILY